MPATIPSHPARKVIDASFPQNISAHDKSVLEAKWNKQAEDRIEAIANETKTPTEESLTLHFQLRKFGKHWNGYYKKGRSYVSVLPTPSLLSSVMDLLMDKMADEALKV